MKIVLSESQVRLFVENTLAEIDSEVKCVNLNPTDKQKEAGNYKMAHIRFGGFAITIENPKNSYRKYKNPDGTEGKNQMKNHYGYFTKTLGRDGDAIDVFIGDTEDFKKVYVVDQNNENGEFDESKVMLGFKSIDDAKKAYKANFSPDWKGFRCITGVPIPFFKKWLYDGRKQRKPFSEYALLKQRVERCMMKESISHKLELDKYYTPDEETEKCLGVLKQTAQENGWNITQYVEPSAGSGAFSSRLDNCLAFDIKPEAEGIQQADFLKLDLPYKKGRCVVGNPPYGEKLNLARAFMKKAGQIGDYIAFVLPMSQLNNNQTLADFKLVKSVPLGDVLYSGQKNVGTCFNIYARTDSGNEKPGRARLNDVTIVRNDSARYPTFQEDFRLGGWGNSVAGRILKPDERDYACTYKIKVNRPELLNKVIEVLQNADWHEETNSYAMLKIQNFHIINLLKREIPEIQ